MTIDHVSVGVSNVKRSKAFYDAALAPLGMAPVYPVEINGQLVGVGYGVDQKPSFWIQLPINGQQASMGNGVHIAFRSETRAGVDAFYLAALEQGGIEDGKPGLRTEYHPDYYGAFVRDPDGNKIEAVSHARMNDDAPIAIIGAGPAGLIAADILSAAGKRVIVYERMPSVARKFLMAGRGGLNLTHSEQFAHFVTRFGEAQPHLQPILEAFTPNDLIAWANGLGQETFVGSSGRVFPKAMKASPLLRALLQRLAAQGVEIQTRANWTGWNAQGALTFGPPASSRHETPSATILALGGASWPKLGSDGAWTDLLAERGVALTPFRPSNVGFDVAWSPHIRERFAGEPLKTIALHHNDREVRGEAMITEYGIEGGAIYALSADLRAAAPTTIHIDLRPALSQNDIAEKLARAKRGDTLSSTLRKTLGLTRLAIALLHENSAPPRDPQALAAHIKAIPIQLLAPRGLDRAISSAGGVRWDAVDKNLQLRAIPNTYVAGEMLDWEAPTGGYLLQASFATGIHVARAILRGAKP